MHTCIISGLLDVDAEVEEGVDHGLFVNNVSLIQQLVV